MSEGSCPAGLRRSGRLAADSSGRTVMLAPRGNDTLGGTRDADEFKGPAQTRKRGKTKADDPETSNVKKKRRKVQLSRLMDMPLDILFEIFGHLHPLDVLHLARTTRAFRDVLMRRSAIAVWKQAREQLEGLPDCPSDLSEPQYANLLFDTHCHFCLSARVMNVMWGCRTRCCKNCWDTHLMVVGGLLGMSVQRVLLASMVPTDIVKGIEYTLRSKYDEIVFISKPFRRADSSAEEGEKFTQQKLAELEEIRKSVSQLVFWQARQADLRAQDKDEIRERRRNAILHELRQLGWAEECARMNIHAKYQFERHALVKQPRELTPRIWNNIKDEIIAFMEQVQKQRLSDERFKALVVLAGDLSKIIKRWTMQQPRTEFLPVPADYCSMPEIEAIVEKWNTDPAAPIDEVEITSLLPELAQRWRHSVSRKVLRLVPGHEDTPETGDVDLSPLHLATTWFQCGSCNAHVNFPRILVHWCMTESDFPDWFEPKLRELSLQEAMNKLTRQSPWHISPLGGLIFNKRLYRSTQTVLKSCGVDAETTTSREMDELGARMICGEAHCMGMEVCAMSWRNALLHRCINGFSLSYPSKFLVIGPDYIKAIRASEDAILHDHSSETKARPMWECLLCDRVRLRFFISIKKHLDDIHHITEPEQGRDYDVDRDSDVSYPGPPIPVRISSRSLQGMEGMEWLESIDL